MKRIVSLILCALLICLSASALADGQSVGVSMPTKDLQRWNQDGENMQKLLEDAGYTVDLQFAANDVQQQLNQVTNMINNGCAVVVIAAIEGSSLGSALDLAKEKGVPVIAYDRLLMESDAVSYYATFDNYKVGTCRAPTSGISWILIMPRVPSIWRLRLAIPETTTPTTSMAAPSMY